MFNQNFQGLTQYGIGIFNGTDGLTVHGMKEINGTYGLNSEGLGLIHRTSPIRGEFAQHHDLYAWRQREKAIYEAPKYSSPKFELPKFEMPKYEPINTKNSLIDFPVYGDNKCRQCGNRYGHAPWCFKK